MRVGRLVTAMSPRVSGYPPSMARVETTVEPQNFFRSGRGRFCSSLFQFLPTAQKLALFTPPHFIFLTCYFFSCLTCFYGWLFSSFPPPRKIMKLKCLKIVHTHFACEKCCKRFFICSRRHVLMQFFLHILIFGKNRRGELEKSFMTEYVMLRCKV